MDIPAILQPQAKTRQKLPVAPNSVDVHSSAGTLRIAQATSRFGEQETRASKSKKPYRLFGRRNDPVAGDLVSKCRYGFNTSSTSTWKKDRKCNTLIRAIQRVSRFKSDQRTVEMPELKHSSRRVGLTLLRLPLVKIRACSAECAKEIGGYICLRARLCLESRTVLSVGNDVPLQCDP